MKKVFNKFYKENRSYLALNTKLIPKYLHNGHGKVLLDIGCGRGEAALQFARWGYSVFAYDSSKEARKQALWHKKITYCWGDFEKTPFPFAHVILCKLSLAFAKNKKKLLKRLIWSLLPGGHLIIISPVKAETPPEKKHIAINEKLLYEATKLKLISRKKDPLSNINTYYFIFKKQILLHNLGKVADKCFPKKCR